MKLPSCADKMMRSKIKLCASSCLSSADNNSKSLISTFVARQNRPRKILFCCLCLFICLSYYVLLVVVNRQALEQMTFAIQHLALAKFENGTVLGEPNGMTDERYRLMERYEQDKLEDDANPPFKRILFWNDFFGIPDFRLGLGREAFRKWDCPVWQCETSTNRTDVHQYDAVIFHMRSWNPNDLPQRRSPQQRYLFWLLESAGWPEYLPMHTSSLGNFFNWTLTYTHNFLGSPKEVDSRFGDPFDDHRMRRRLRSTMFELRREAPELVDPLCFETTITFCKVTEGSG